MNDLIGKEISCKCKLIKGQKIKEGSLVKLAKMSKIRIFLARYGLMLPIVELAMSENWADFPIGIMTKGKLLVFRHTIKDIDTSAFKEGERLYISGLKPDDFRCSKGASIVKEIKPGIYQVKLDD